MNECWPVGIVGAGPAGLLLGNLLLRSGVDCLILEARSREHIENRARAGLITHSAVDVLARNGLADGLLAHSTQHTACEFRHDGRRFSVEYGRLSGGGCHYVYPQQFLVRDLLQAFLDAGGSVRFDTRCTSIGSLIGPEPVTVDADHGGSKHRVLCQHLAGCDGQHGICATAIPKDATTTVSKHYDAGWLAILAQTPPMTKQIIYGLHDDGFAGHMLRTPEVSRFYLQCDADDNVGDWPDERIWHELNHRLALNDDTWRLTPGPILERQVLSLHSAVTIPMQYGKLHLVGDAAHIVSPAGAKGMNMALADAADLAQAHVSHHYDNDRRALDTYSQRRLPQVWRAVEFSDRLLQLLHSPPVTDQSWAFNNQLRLNRLGLLRDSPAEATAFAEGYVAS